MPDESPQKVVTEDGRKPREKHPTYDVFMQEDTLHERPLWLMIGEKVSAPNRREAIKGAAAAWRLPDGSQLEDAGYGTFAVVRAGEFQVLTRNKKVVTADEWS